MSEPVAIDRLFETHLPVRDLDRSVAFYRDVVGLQPALHDPDLGAAFFWIGAAGQAMLGLWAAGRMGLANAGAVRIDRTVSVLRLNRPNIGVQRSPNRPAKETVFQSLV